MPNKLSFELGKLIAGYIFLGTCITIVLFPYLDKTNIPKLQDILTTGAIIGGFLSTFQLHKIAGYLYFQNSLTEALEQSKLYPEFENQRNIFYFRFLYIIGFFLLLITNGILTFFEFFFNQSLITFDPNIIYIVTVLFLILSIYLFLKSYYSIVELLVLFRFMNYASKGVQGFDRLEDIVHNVNLELMNGNWKEAKHRFERVIQACYASIHSPLKMETIRTLALSKKDLNLFGIKYIHFKNQYSVSDVIKIGKRVELLENKQKTPLTFSKDEDKRDLLDTLEKSLKPTLEVWKIHNWDDYLKHNLPFWLYLNWKKKIKSIINWILKPILKYRKKRVT